MPKSLHYPKTQPVKSTIMSGIFHDLITNKQFMVFEFLCFFKRIVLQFWIKVILYLNFSNMNLKIILYDPKVDCKIIMHFYCKLIFISISNKKKMQGNPL